ncbi:hypothetical protein QYM36_000197 [Artemia franciscana]|uniref:Reverse transcriptase domain-containing protein n=1 Tax=Artemia franciscana TaxID=6661 RepID=A0AA88ICK4_ARTSF|nr:hypothetical protein QYM36_000197 [Artemia franciscana]
MAPRPNGQLNQSRALIQEPAIDMLILAERERNQRDEERSNFVVAGLPENDGCTDTEKVVKLCEDHDLGARLADTEILETVRIGSVLRAMKGMKASKALNPDGIPSFILKEVRDYVNLWQYFSKSRFEKCKFPTSWKLSHVTPIFKGKGKRSDPKNYRPISLTSPFLKIMERVIVEKLNSHLELDNLISDHQHGFRKNRSTVSQLVVIHEYIQSTLDRGIPIDIILIDLLKAFDRISLRKLIHCLEVHGVKKQLKDWLSAYTNDRKIAVKVAETLSTWTDATSGVPQGSFLGPVLFVMYIDICINSISQTDFGLFADDTKLLGEASASSQSQSDLDTLREKLEEWQLSPNVAKCSVVHLGRQNPKYSYKMKGIDLTKSTCEKDLGVILSLDLKPEKHIGLVVRKASNTLWLLTHSLRYLDIHSKISAYTSYVRPQLEYATVIWSPYLKKDIDRIERVQKRFVKGLQGFRNLPFLPPNPKKGACPQEPKIEA